MASKIGTKLWRVKYANDATSYDDLMAAWHEIVKAKASIREWPAAISRSKIARLSLEYWRNDVCVTCGGKGHEPVLNQPSVLRDEPCSACNGTAKRPIEARQDVLKYVEDMVEALEAITIHAGGETMRKLNKQMEF